MVGTVQESAPLSDRGPGSYRQAGVCLAVLAHGLGARLCHPSAPALQTRPKTPARPPGATGEPWRQAPALRPSYRRGRRPQSPCHDAGGQTAHGGYIQVNEKRNVAVGARRVFLHAPSGSRYGVPARHRLPDIEVSDCPLFISYRPIRRDLGRLHCVAWAIDGWLFKVVLGLPPARLRMAGEPRTPRSRTKRGELLRSRRAFSFSSRIRDFLLPHRNELAKSRPERSVCDESVKPELFDTLIRPPTGQERHPEGGCLSKKWSGRGKSLELAKRHLARARDAAPECEQRGVIAHVAVSLLRPARVPGADTGILLRYTERARNARVHAGIVARLTGRVPPNSTEQVVAFSIMGGAALVILLARLS